MQADEALTLRWRAGSRDARAVPRELCAQGGLAQAQAQAQARAHACAQGLQLDQEGGAQPHAGPVVTSYWAMARRVRQLEVRARACGVALC